MGIILSVKMEYIFLITHLHLKSQWFSDKENRFKKTSSLWEYFVESVDDPSLKNNHIQFKLSSYWFKPGIRPELPG